jgi:hypothetical protein
MSGRGWWLALWLCVLVFAAYSGVRNGQQDARIDRLEQQQKDAPVSVCVVPERQPDVRICRAK